MLAEKLNGVGTLEARAVVVAALDAPTASDQWKRSSMSYDAPAVRLVSARDRSLYASLSASAPSAMSVHPRSPVVGQVPLASLRRYWYLASDPVVSVCGDHCRSIDPAAVVDAVAEKPVGVGTAVGVPCTDDAADISELVGRKRSSMSYGFAACRPVSVCAAELRFVPVMFVQPPPDGQLSVVSLCRTW